MGESLSLRTPGGDGDLPINLAAQEPFDRPGAMKIGLLGGRQTGKTFLFQAMLFRSSGYNMGALSYFRGRKSVSLYMGRSRSDRPISRAVDKANEIYRTWYRFPPTKAETVTWYRLCFPYRVGWWGGTTADLIVDFCDGSGELLRTGIKTEDDLEHWRVAYLHATVMIFCMPMWALFPNYPRFEHKDHEARAEAIKDFSEIVDSLRQLRKASGVSHPVRTILVLTMADDKLCALDEVRTQWIDRSVSAAAAIQARLRKGPGIAEYLESARQVSDYVGSEIRKLDNPVNETAERLNFDAGAPWIVPVTAINGARLHELERMTKEEAEKTPERRQVEGYAPKPAHVELPLVLALCERTNMLM